VPSGCVCSNRRLETGCDTCSFRVRLGADALASHVEKSRLCVNLYILILDTIVMQDALICIAVVLMLLKTEVWGFNRSLKEISTLTAQRSLSFETSRV
jgi:hypothetical protein